GDARGPRHRCAPRVDAVLETLRGPTDGLSGRRAATERIVSCRGRDGRLARMASLGGTARSHPLRRSIRCVRARTRSDSPARVHGRSRRGVGARGARVRVAVATDHGGFALKSTVLDAVREAGHDPLDLGTHSTDPVDYPDFAAAAARAVQDGRAERAIVLCGSGVGAAIAANKLAGIRAGVCHDVYSAHQAVEHDDVSVLALGARVIGPSLATDLVRTFLT